MEVSKAEVVERIHRHHTHFFCRRNIQPDSPHAQYKPAAVLVPLFFHQGELHVLLTKRSMYMTSHPGDVSLPGGKMDASDKDEVETSLREAEERIGLHRDLVEVIGQIPPILNREGYLVTPTVGFMPGNFQPKPNHSEVEETFSLPLSRFLNTRNCHYRKYTFLDAILNVPFFVDKMPDTGKLYQTWGLTAFICIALAVILYEKKTEFELAPGVVISPEDPFAVFYHRLINMNIPASKM